MFTHLSPCAPHLGTLCLDEHTGGSFADTAYFEIDIACPEIVLVALLFSRHNP